MLHAAFSLARSRVRDPRRVRFPWVFSDNCVGVLDELDDVRHVLAVLFSRNEAY